MMTHEEQVQAFIFEITRTIDRFAEEFDLLNVDIVGSLDMIKHEFITRTLRDDDNDHDEDNP